MRTPYLLWLFFAAISGCAHLSQTNHEAQAEALDAPHLLAVAKAAEQLGDHLRAQQYLLAASKAGANPEQTLPWLMRLYVADSQYRLAIDTAQDFLRAHPHNTRLRLVLAGLYEATQLEAAAMEQYQQVLSAAPERADAHFALAMLLRDHGHDPGRADEHFRAYLALAPKGENADEARASLLQELP